MEMKAHAEHEKNDARLGQIIGQIRIGHEAGRKRADEKARREISHNGGQAHPLRQVTENQRQTEADGEDLQQMIAVHMSSFSKNIDTYICII